MSVGVKTPTQFQHPEFPCGQLSKAIKRGRNAGGANSDGEADVASGPLPTASAIRSRSQSVNVRPSAATKDSFLEIKDSKKQQGQSFRRRRFLSHSHQRQERGGGHSDRGQQIRRRRHSTKGEIVLPTKFLLGGNINDPLNLNGLPTDNAGEATPVSSPIATPAHRRQVNLIIPPNITDPLNLNCDDEEAEQLSKLQQRKKKRIKHHKKKDSSSSLLSDNSALEQSASDLTKPLSIEIGHDLNVSSETSHSASKSSESKVMSPHSLQDKIVSPVIPQISPKRRRKRTSSECKPDPTPGATRNILREDSDVKCDTTSPSRTKYRRQHSSGQNQESGQPLNKKPRNNNQSKFIYGNYSRYYGYRNPSLDEDVRLKCFKRDWFDGKDVLDIGCNVGHVTLAIALFFHPRRITGIDIDGKLIGAARKNIKHYVPGGETAVKFPSSMKTCYGSIKKNMEESQTCQFPKNVNFRQANYVLENDALLEMQKPEYDCILALSVTKWVHLNWGDDGLKRFLRRISRQLRPGGVFILEPQPWNSYKKKKKLTETIHKNFQEIQFKPESFREYLLSEECGFTSCQIVNAPCNKSRGFRRPVQIYRKPKPEPEPAVEETTVAEQPQETMETNYPFTSILPMIPGHGLRRHSMPAIPGMSWSAPASLGAPAEALQEICEEMPEESQDDKCTETPENIEMAESKSSNVEEKPMDDVSEPIMSESTASSPRNGEPKVAEACESSDPEASNQDCVERETEPKVSESCESRASEASSQDGGETESKVEPKVAETCESGAPEGSNQDDVERGSKVELEVAKTCESGAPEASNQDVVERGSNVELELAETCESGAPEASNQDCVERGSKVELEVAETCESGAPEASNQDDVERGSNVELELAETCESGAPEARNQEGDERESNVEPENVVVQKPDSVEDV